MFIGHYAVGFAAKPFAPKTSLGFLIAAPLFLDLLWPVFLLLGIEHGHLIPDAETPFLRLGLDDYPRSHSLVMSLVWSLLCGGVYWLVTKYGRGAIAIGIGVFSHWVLDFVTHRPDMQIYPGGGPKVGLGLWHSTIGTIAAESVLFIIGVALYARTTRARDRVGTFSFWGFVVLLVLGYVASIVSPAPPDMKSVAIGAMVGWVILLWPRWFDRHRESIAPAA